MSVFRGHMSYSPIRANRRVMVLRFPPKAGRPRNCRMVILRFGRNGEWVRGRNFGQGTIDTHPRQKKSLISLFSTRISS